MLYVEGQQVPKKKKIGKKLLFQISWKLVRQTEDSVLSSVLVVTIPYDIYEKVIEHPLDHF